VRWSDDRLLDLRLCDLDLKLEGPLIPTCLRQLDEELERRDLRFRPHFWLGEEWFTPDGVTGAAIPFYLAHPRLMRLERRQMLEVEGGTHKEFMQILRHEVGHAIDHAYRLHRRRRWQQHFGRSSEPYPDVYKPRPVSKRYVLHLDNWYAQSHPDEDFAETFAVWLTPRSVWRKRYQGWPALKKLEYVDELMQEIGPTAPLVRSKARTDDISRIRRTLREHYEGKRSRYGADYPDFYDQDLRRLFTDETHGRGRESAAAFIRRNRGEIRRMVARWTGQYQYTLDLVLKEMIGRCRDLKLRVSGPERQVMMDFAILLTVQTMNYLHSGRHRLSM
jgi:hypothetical protein